LGPGRATRSPGEEIKTLLRRGFSYGGLEVAMEDALAEFVSIVRQGGFEALIEILEAAEQELLESVPDQAPPG
jgi:hypothetical protein